MEGILINVAFEVCHLRVLAAGASAETGQNRITLTGSAFQQATCITYHVIGSEKAGIISDLVSKSPKSKKFPAAHISGEWYLDQAAASSLEHLGIG